MRNPRKITNGFIEIEVVDSRLTKEKKAELELKKKELLDNLQEASGLTSSQKRALGLEDSESEDPYTFTDYLTDNDFEEFTYKKYIREDLRIFITDRGEKDFAFLDIDGEEMKVKESVENLLKKFAQ